MKRKNTQAIGEVLRDFFEDNTELYEKILEIRVERAWKCSDRWLCNIPVIYMYAIIYYMYR